VERLVRTSRVADCPLSCSSSCKGRLSYDSCVCQNPSCAAFGSDSTPPELYFDLKVTIADHTDGISIRLLNQTAEAFLQCSVRRMLCAAWLLLSAVDMHWIAHFCLCLFQAQQYVAMTRGEKVQIRSKLLLERWKFYLKVRTPVYLRRDHHTQTKELLVCSFALRVSVQHCSIR